MSEVYVIEQARDDRFSRVGWLIHDTRGYSYVQVVDMESRAYSSSDLVFDDLDHAEDFEERLFVVAPSP